LHPINYQLLIINCITCGNKEETRFSTPEDDQSDVCGPHGDAGDEYLQRGS
jgi:hypothetical protein